VELRRWAVVTDIAAIINIFRATGFFKKNIVN